MRFSAVAFSVLLGLLGCSTNFTRLLHTGRLPLKFAYCALYVAIYVLVELAFTYQTIVALSAKLTKATTSAYWMSSAYVHSIFIGALPPPKKYVEQVEKSFLSNEGGCRDVTS